MKISINNEAIWGLLEPWIPTITQIIKDNRNREEFGKFYPDEPYQEPALDWIFLRKYLPDAEPNSLTVHHDTNMNTVNNELSDNYEGGGLFHMKPLVDTGKIKAYYNGYE